MEMDIQYWAVTRHMMAVWGCGRIWHSSLRGCQDSDSEDYGCVMRVTDVNIGVKSRPIKWAKFSILYLTYVL